LSQNGEFVELSSPDQRQRLSEAVSRHQEQIDRGSRSLSKVVLQDQLDSLRCVVGPLQDRVDAFKRLRGVLNSVNRSRPWLDGDCGDDWLSKAREALAAGQAFERNSTAAAAAGEAVNDTEITRRANETNNIFAKVDAANLVQKADEAKTLLGFLDGADAKQLPDDDRQRLEGWRAALNRGCLPDVNAITAAISAAKAKMNAAASPNAMQRLPPPHRPIQRIKGERRKALIRAAAPCSAFFLGALGLGLALLLGPLLGRHLALSSRGTLGLTLALAVALAVALCFGLPPCVPLARRLFSPSRAEL
jgi:hypothetical protein